MAWTYLLYKKITSRLPVSTPIVLTDLFKFWSIQAAKKWNFLVIHNWKLHTSLQQVYIRSACKRSAWGLFSFCKASCVPRGSQYKSRRSWVLKTISYVFLIAYLSDWVPLISVFLRQQIKAAAKYNYQGFAQFVTASKKDRSSSLHINTVLNTNTKAQIFNWFLYTCLRH